MGFLDAILGLFGKKEEEEIKTRVPAAQKKPLAKQVYTGRESDVPEWAQDMKTADLIEACLEHNVCKYVPHIETKKIFSTRKGFDGNLETEYDGIAADCGAMKNFGMAVAKRDGFLQPYRYVDLNHIFKCCCERPKLCPFYELAMGESTDLQARQKRL